MMSLPSSLFTPPSSLFTLPSSLFTPPSSPLFPLSALPHSHLPAPLPPPIFIYTSHTDMCTLCITHDVYSLPSPPSSLIFPPSYRLHAPLSLPSPPSSLYPPPPALSHPPYSSTLLIQTCV